MAEAIVGPGYEYFADPTKSRPIFDGFIFVGNIDTDPEQPSNQIAVDVLQENGTRVTIPAGQQNTTPGTELRTGPGGIVVYNGSPAQILTESNYSLKVLNKQRSQVLYNNPNVLRFNIAGLGQDGGVSLVDNALAGDLTVAEMRAQTWVSSKATSTGTETIRTNFYNASVICDWRVFNNDPGAGFVLQHDTLSVWFQLVPLFGTSRPEISPLATGAAWDYDVSGDTGTDDATAFQAAINLCSGGDYALQIPPGDGYVNAAVTVPTSGPTVGQNWVGSGKRKSRIYTKVEGAFITHAPRMVCKSFGVHKVGSPGTTRLFTTPLSGSEAQAVHCEWDDIEVGNAKYGFWQRASIYNSFTNIECIDNLCGIRLSRNALPDDQSNPNSPGNWNQFSPDIGWFHNVIHMHNVVLQGGEVGFWGCPMSITMDTINCQRSAGGDPSTNVVLPVNEVRTGIYIESGVDGNRQGRNITIDQLYTESCRRPIYVKDTRSLVVNNLFVQGGSGGDPYDAVVHSDNSLVWVNQGVGQDTFNLKLRAENNSVVTGDIPGSLSDPNTPDSIDSTSRWYRNGAQERYISRFRVNKPAGSTSTTQIPITLQGQSYYRIEVQGLRDGSNHQQAVYHASRWNSNTLTIIYEVTGTPGNLDVAVSGVNGILQLTISTTLAYDARIVVEDITQQAYQEIELTP